MPVRRNNRSSYHSKFTTIRKGLFTMSEFCEWAKIKKNKGYELINAGEIGYLRTQGETGHVRFTHGHIMDWLKRQERKSKYDNF